MVESDYVNSFRVDPDGSGKASHDNTESKRPLPMYSLGGDLRFSAFTKRLLAVDFSSSVLLVSIMSPSSVEITCCCFRGFFRGEAPGGRSLVGMDRLLASNARDGDIVLAASGGTAAWEKAHTCMRTQRERSRPLLSTNEGKQKERPAWRFPLCPVPGKHQPCRGGQAFPDTSHPTPLSLQEAQLLAGRRSDGQPRAALLNQKHRFQPPGWQGQP